MPCGRSCDGIASWNPGTESGYYIEVTVLAAWCELRDDFRHFRADRIVACRETGDSFVDLAPRLRRDWRARRGMPGLGQDDES